MGHELISECNCTQCEVTRKIVERARRLDLFAAAALTGLIQVMDLEVIGRKALGDYAAKVARATLEAIDEAGE